MTTSLPQHRCWESRLLFGATALIGVLSAVSCSDSTYSDSESAETQQAAVEEGEWLPGGGTTNTLVLGSNAFSFPSENLEGDRRNPFFTGNSFFKKNWVTAPASTMARDGLGPTFNSRSCGGCHFKDGRGRPPIEDGEIPEALLFRLSVPGTDENGGPRPDPVYGGQLQLQSIADVPVEGEIQIEYEEVTGQFDDGTEYSLRKPTYSIVNAAFGEPSDDLMMSPRVAPAVIGLGLLEAIPEARLEELADPDDENDDGVSGRINRVWDKTEQSLRPGRFGWKAEQPSVLQQSAGAFNGDIGITSSLFPDNNCPQAQSECSEAQNGGEPEIPDHLLEAVVFYTQTLAPPVRSDWDDPEVLRGKGLFSLLGCANCHVPSHKTASHEIPELEDHKIWPYTDLLLHDMGDDLADDRPTYEATGNEWRTPPLWGLSQTENVSGHTFFLHDGRARNLTEAVLWHGGEAESARDGFRALSKDERNALVRFLESL